MGTGGDLCHESRMATTVTNNEARSRYELEADGVLSICEYLLDGNRIIFHHTLVPSELEGRGIGARLVTAALDDAESKGLEIVPQCWFVAKVLERRAAR
ncbi:GNAT family N-acetyltransferase [Sandaracinobacteroides hominis]|uniref:GNAT family N-acetyltransferase n=1 Tax=Sandaracinobacteroides hominis TaxID=2780086 RepID=UPI0018F731F4|nr:GNAT family N-acetyltransferase [Sandaracinobacteroides hominis]